MMWQIATRISALQKPTKRLVVSMFYPKSMTEEVNDVAEDTSSEVDEATDSNTSEEDTGGEEDTEVIKADLANALKAKAELTARAKKAEEELKALKAKPQDKPNDPQLSDELKLIARGLSDEAIEQAKVIAKGKGIPMTEAIKDPLFLTYQKDAEEKEKKEKAKLGASKGSGETNEEPEVKSGMTRDEHQKVFQKKVGK